MTELEQLVAWLDRIGVKYSINKFNSGSSFVVCNSNESDLVGLRLWFDEHECAKVDNGQFSW